MLHLDRKEKEQKIEPDSITSFLFQVVNIYKVEGEYA